MQAINSIRKVKKTNSFNIETKPDDLQSILIAIAEYYSSLIVDNYNTAPSFDIFDERVYPLSSVQPSNKAPQMIVILLFISSIIKRGYTSIESLIISVCFLRQVLNNNKQFQLTQFTWRRALLISICTATKVHSEDAIWNKDFLDSFKKAKGINQLEIRFLQTLEFNTNISKSKYCSTYFDVRGTVKTQ